MHESVNTLLCFQFNCGLHSEVWQSPHLSLFSIPRLACAYVAHPLQRWKGSVCNPGRAQPARHEAIHRWAIYCSTGRGASPFTVALRSHPKARGEMQQSFLMLQLMGATCQRSNAREHNFMAHKHSLFRVGTASECLKIIRHFPGDLPKDIKEGGGGRVGECK